MKEWARKAAVLTLLAFAMSTPFVADAQSFNVDVDSHFVPPPLGGGVPSSSFGAAANQPGLWFKLNTYWGAEYLTDIHGNATSVQISDSNGGSGSAYNLPVNTGDYALLLNDARSIGRWATFSFSLAGLENRLYDVYLYSVALHTTTTPLRTKTRIAQSLISEDQMITGPMPGNSLEEGITHSVHRVNVVNGTLDISLICDNSEASEFNGFQIVQVPEPQLIISFSFPFVIVVRQVFRSRKGGT